MVSRLPTRSIQRSSYAPEHRPAWSRSPAIPSRSGRCGTFPTAVWTGSNAPAPAAAAAATGGGAAAAGRGGGAATSPFEDYMLKELIPFVDAKYRTAPGPKSRAMAGLSAGGAATYNVGLKHLELF